MRNTYCACGYELAYPTIDQILEHEMQCPVCGRIQYIDEGVSNDILIDLTEKVEELTEKVECLSEKINDIYESEDELIAGLKVGLTS